MPSDRRRVRPGGWSPVWTSGSLPAPPPPGLRGGASGWIELRLTAAEQKAKRDALQRYQTQERMMSWFLDSFARANEIFSRPAPPHVVLPARRNLCCDE